MNATATKTYAVVHETEYDGVPIRVRAVLPAGTYRPTWVRNGHEQTGDAYGTVLDAVAAARESIRWDILASNPNA